VHRQFGAQKGGDPVTFNSINGARLFFEICSINNQDPVTFLQYREEIEALCPAVY
jgi:hypothetical protein